MRFGFVWNGWRPSRSHSAYTASRGLAPDHQRISKRTFAHGHAHKSISVVSDGHRLVDPVIVPVPEEEGLECCCSAEGVGGDLDITHSFGFLKVVHPLMGFPCLRFRHSTSGKVRSDAIDLRRVDELRNCDKNVRTTVSNQSLSNIRPRPFPP